MSLSPNRSPSQSRSIFSTLSISSKGPLLSYEDVLRILLVLWSTNIIIIRVLKCSSLERSALISIIKFKLDIDINLFVSTPVLSWTSYNIIFLSLFHHCICILETVPCCHLVERGCCSSFVESILILRNDSRSFFGTSPVSLQL